MSLEDLLKENTEALKANTAALKAAGGSNKAAGGTGTGNKPTGPKLEEIVTVLTEIKEAHGAPEYKKVLAKFKAAKSADLKPEDYAKVLKAAKDHLEALNNAGGEGEGEGESDDL